MLRGAISVADGGAVEAALVAEVLVVADLVAVAAAEGGPGDKF
jgi:hypothetical protein